MSLPEAMLPEEWSGVCVPLVSVEEVFTPDDVELEVLEDCGVFWVSSVRVDPDALGVVEVCAASIDTEKTNAAAVVINFFMVLLSPGG
jgi:hypothetical protein